MWGDPTAVLIAYVMSLLLGLVLYLVGGLLAPKGEKTAGKLAPYACGEDLPPIRPRLNLERFYIYVVLFLVFDITIFLAAASMYNPGVYPALYILTALLAASLLYYLREGA